jgi:hypothetical protein
MMVSAAAETAGNPSVPVGSDADIGSPTPGGHGHADQPTVDSLESVRRDLAALRAEVHELRDDLAALRASLGD